jgi:hypothetical protein
MIGTSIEGLPRVIGAADATLMLGCDEYCEGSEFYIDLQVNISGDWSRSD